MDATNIKLFASERLEDTDDAGGRITGNVIISGQENNIFPDISRINTTIGRVNIRKLFGGVDTDTLEKYYGPHFIISENPSDDNVKITLFSTADWDDTRDNLQNYIESYLYKGAKWFGYLYEKQIKGTKVLTIWQRESTELPDIGAVWCLTQNDGLVSEYSQYVRIVKYQEQLREFYESGKRFLVRVLTIEIAEPLEDDFTGIAPTLNDSSSSSTIRETIAVDSARYYGCHQLAQDAAQDELSVYVDSIYNQIVPSSNSETGLVDVSAASQQKSVIDSSNGLVTFTSDSVISSSVGFYLGNGCFPSSLSIAVTGGTIIDDGGDLKIGSTTVGIIDYSNGLCTFNLNCPTYTGTKTITFRPAAPLLSLSETSTIIVTELNRGYVFTNTLKPYPNAGSVFVDYMSQGKWYRLFDNGAGVLKGLDSAYGTGTINYSTGGIILTLGALPDVNTNIIFYWNTPSTTFNRSNIALETPFIEINLTHQGCVKNTYNCEWTTSTNTLVSVSDNGNGVLSGTGGTGTIDYVNSKVKIKPTLLPLGGTSFFSTYQYGDALQQAFQAPLRDGNGNLNLTLDYQNILAGSVKMVFNVLIADYEAISGTSLAAFGFPNYVDPYVTTFDDEAGGFTNAVIDGSIDYVNGTIQFLPEQTLSIPKPVFESIDLGTRRVYENGQAVVKRLIRNVFKGFEYIPAGAVFPINETGLVTVYYRSTDTLNQINDEEFVLDNLIVDLTTNYRESVVATSSRFTLGGKTYFDNNGSLYHSLDNTTGVATLAGSLDYNSGIATITNWNVGQSNVISLKSLLTEFNAQLVDEVTFRCAGSPIKSGSFQFSAVLNDGTEISATSNFDGTITGTHIDGHIDYELGIIQIAFGDWLTAAGNENEEWYHEENLRIDGKVFKSVLVLPQSIKYNCVIKTYLPLNADLLGLNPVRLPIDGKVPVYKKGDVLVVHDTQQIILTNPLSAGAVIDCGRERLSTVEVQDQNKLVVSPTLYTSDLDAGIVTFGTPLDLSAYSQPLKLLHTVEDIVLCVDVEINGKLSINRPLSHNYDKDFAKVSTALVTNEWFARYTNPFSQGSWSSVWSDTIIGSPIIPQYNYNQNPILLTNAGTIQQRWALIFTSTTDFRIVGETLGQIGTGSINTDCSPLNSNNSKPYFTLYSAGFGSGWSAGNVIRFNTIAANYPISIIRTILQSNTTITNDYFRIAIRGDIDN